MLSTPRPARSHRAADTCEDQAQSRTQPSTQQSARLSTWPAVRHLASRLIPGQLDKDHTTVPAKLWAGARDAVDHLRQRLARARKYPGYERDIALLMIKSTLAGVISWSLAEYVVTSPQPTYAPFVALLVVQSTIYRSLLQSVQYVTAVIVGVLAAGLAGPLLGENVIAFGAMLVIGLLVGRWRRLGTMGIQAPIAGIFAYAAMLGSARVGMLGSIVAMVLLGAGVGLAINLLLLPPMRYADANAGVEGLSTAVSDLLGDIAEALREGTPRPETADDWQRRARGLDTTVANARRAVEQGTESISFNPRRMFQKHHSVTFSGYNTMVTSLARVSEALRSIAFDLRSLLDDATGPTTDESFFRPYAEILGLAADGLCYLGSTAADAEERLRQTARACEERCEELQSKVKGGTGWAVLGGLVTDTARLVEELDNAHARGAVRAD